MTILPFMRVLVDTSVFEHANAFAGEWHSTGVKNWGGIHPIETGYIATAFSGKPVKRTKGGMQSHSLGALAREFMKCRIKAYTTEVLNFERWDKPV